MAEYHFPVPGSENEKEIVIFVRRHWASFLGQFLLSFFLLIIPIIILIFIFVYNRDFLHGIVVNFVVFLLSIYYLIALSFVFAAWITFYYDIYIITTSEIIDIHQTGFWGRKIAQLSLLRVQDVTSNIKGVLPTLFSYGDIVVETAGAQAENFLLEAVPNPQEVSSKVMQLHNELIEGEGRQDQMLEAEGVLEGRNHNEDIKKEAPPEIVESQPKTEENSQPVKTSYQELLEKESSQQSSEEDGEVSKDDLNKGGEIKL